MAEMCSYPQCQKCEFEYCIKDGQIALNLTPKTKDRSGYLHQYYEEHKEQKQAYYTSKSHYICKRDVKSAVNKLKKDIGRVNAELVLQAIDKLETIYK